MAARRRPGAQRTDRPRSCWPAGGTSGWRRPSSTGCTTRCAIPATGLIRDGVRVDRDGSVRAIEGNVHYCGACTSERAWLAEVDDTAERQRRWSRPRRGLLDAVATHVGGSDGVIPGYDDGDEALFNGILARYLADARCAGPSSHPSRPGSSRERCSGLAGRPELADGQCSPRTGDARLDIPIPAGRRRTCRCSSGWMVLEAAAAVQRAACGAGSGVGRRPASRCARSGAGGCGRRERLQGGARLRRSSPAHLLTSPSRGDLALPTTNPTTAATAPPSAATVPRRATPRRSSRAGSASAPRPPHPAFAATNAVVHPRGAAIIGASVRTQGIHTVPRRWPRSPNARRTPSRAVLQLAGTRPSLRGNMRVPVKRPTR